MIVHNNLAAMQVVNVLNQNTKDKEKNIRALSSGEKISSAGDGASEYGISEKMRVQLRALGQNDRNVQNGSKLLKTAEGGIQEQIELMKKIKGLVIQASNSYLTDEDLAIIQKDIDACYDEIEDIAVKTNFNEIGLLNGSIADKVVVDWAKLSEPKEIANSGLDLIPGGTQPFEKVKPYEFDFAGKTADDLRGKTFTVEDEDGNIKTYMFNDNVGDVPSGVTRIPIGNGTPSGNYSIETITTYFASAISNGNNLAYKSSGTKAQIYCGGDRAPVKISGMDDFLPCKLDGANELDKKLSGGGAGAPATHTLDFTSYDSVNAISNLDGKGFTISDGNYQRSYVFQDTSKGKTYSGTGATIINITGITNAADLATKVNATLNKSYLTTDTSDSGKIKLTTTIKGTSANNAYVEGLTVSAADEKPSKELLDATGASNIGTGRLSGGTNAEPYIDADNPGKPGTAASMSLNYKKPAVGTGFTITSNGYPYTHQVRFISGSGVTANYKGSGVLAIGVDSFKDGFSYTFGSLKLSVSGGKINYTATSVGAGYNGYGITSDSGFGAVTSPATAAHDAISPLYGGRTKFTGGSDSTDKAKTTVDISGYTSKAELINNLAGTGFYFYDSSAYTTQYFEFINSAETDPDKKAQKEGTLANSVKLDLNTIGDGNPAQLATALVNLLKANDHAGADHFSITADNKLEITCKNAGDSGNNSRVHTLGTLTGDFEGESEYAQYPIDFKDWIATHSAEIREGGGLVEYLTGKGFRTDCSTCSNQWFNFEFVTDDEVQRPNTEGDGTVNSDIHNYSINITGVTDAESLVKAIYEQGVSKLEETNHFMSMKPEKDADGNFTGTLIMYDNRMILDPDTRVPRADNAVIRDGIKSDWARADRALEVEELYIHHMQRANMNIHLKIPKTTLDNIFNYNKEYHSIKEYNVFTKESRDRMLGKPPKEDGEVDKALNYLSSAITLVGAQNARLEQADANIITQHENTTAAESTIRDTNMAKSMVAFTKSSILTQTAQAMLAQANMKPQSILSLLQ